MHSAREQEGDNAGDPDPAGAGLERVAIAHRGVLTQRGEAALDHPRRRRLERLDVAYRVGPGVVEDPYAVSARARRGLHGQLGELDPWTGFPTGGERGDLAAPQGACDEDSCTVGQDE